MTTPDCVLKELFVLAGNQRMERMISVIVPVYQAQEYLEQCINSILGQDYENLEVLLIEDGSEDGSVRICEEYERRSDRVRLIRQKNQGASEARNNGLRHARGEYVVFVDADDYVEGRHSFSHLVQKMNETKADIVVGDYSRLWDGKLLAAEKTKSFCEIGQNEGAFRFQGFFSVGTLAYVWCKLYRNSFLQENQLCFGDYNWAEDKMFNLQCYIKGAKYAFLSEMVYVYRKNDKSISFQFREDSPKNWIKMAGELEKSIRSGSVYDSCEDLVACTIFFAVFFDAKMYYEQSGRRFAAIRKILKEYAGYPLARKYFALIFRGSLLRSIPSVLWKLMIRGFACAMHFHCHFLLAVGIQMLIHLRMDERLSDTGLRE